MDDVPEWGGEPPARGSPPPSPPDAADGGGPPEEPAAAAGQAAPNAISPRADSVIDEAGPSSRGQGEAARQKAGGKKAPLVKQSSIPSVGGKPKSKPKPMEGSVDEQVAQLEREVKVEQERLAAAKRSDPHATGGPLERVAPGQQPNDIVSEARAQRDAVRKELQKAQARLTLLTAERKASSKKLEKLAEREKSNRVANPELPSVALRGGGDDETTSEIRQIVRGARATPLAQCDTRRGDAWRDEDVAYCT